LAALAAFAAIVIGSFEPFYIGIYKLDTARIRAVWEELPWRRLPRFRRLLIDVDRSTPPGARIAIWLPYDKWDGGYGYGYMRAGFLVPSKQLVPLMVVETDVAAPENIAGAEYVAAWGGTPEIPGFTPVWRSEAGVLMRRVR
jgi:hypothetical protein